MFYLEVCLSEIVDIIIKDIEIGIEKLAVKLSAKRTLKAEMCDVRITVHPQATHITNSYFRY